MRALTNKVISRKTNIKITKLILLVSYADSMFSILFNLIGVGEGAIFSTIFPTVLRIISSSCSTKSSLI